MHDVLSKARLFATLPPPWLENLRPQIRAHVAARPAHKLVVLDDDPTGTQTVHDIPVLTTWDVPALQTRIHDARAVLLQVSQRGSVDDAKPAIGKTVELFGDSIGKTVELFGDSRGATATEVVDRDRSHIPHRHSPAGFLLDVGAQVGCIYRRIASGGIERQTVSHHGGLVMVGSYVPKTTEQLTHLENSGAAHFWILEVESLLNESEREEAIRDAVFKLEFAYRRGVDVVLATSRELVTGPSAIASLEIGRRVSEALVEIVRRLKARPRYIIAKGGIPSSDLATRGLGVKRAMVIGQLLPGVPIWELGHETKFPGLPYIVFPGNVGDPNALLLAVSRLAVASAPAPSTP